MVRFCPKGQLEVGPTFALMPVSILLMTNAGIRFVSALILGPAIAAAVGFANGFITRSLSG
jgi:ribose/xylose/arabinose/galactoside ABC-type transport system permease subunit